MEIREFEYEFLLKAGRDYDLSREMALKTCSTIPDGSEGWANVMEDYLSSPLHEFHRDFDSLEHFWSIRGDWNPYESVAFRVYIL